MSKSNELKKDIQKIDKLLGNKSPKEIKKKHSLELLEKISKSLESDKTGDVVTALIETKQEISDLNAKFIQVFGEDSLLTAFSNIVDAVSESVEKNEKALSELNTKDITTALDKLIVAVENQEFPTQIEVTNQPEFPEEIKISNPQTEVEVSNLAELKEAIEGIKFPENIKVDNFPTQKESIRVSNFPASVKLQKPAWWKQFTIDELKTTLTGLFEGLKTMVFKVDAGRHENPKNAIAVKLVDKDGKVIDSLIPHVTVSGGGGGGGGVEIVGVKNALDARINPATAEKQDAIISALGGTVSESVILAEDSGDVNVTYIGKAPIATATSGAGWRIQKLDETTGLIMTWADGNDSYDNIFDNREALSYS